MRQVKNLQRTVIEVGAKDLWLWFEESIRTARRLPAVKPKGYKAAWVDIPTDWHSYGWEKAKIKLPPPSGKQLSRLDLVMALLAVVDEEDRRKLVWMRARKYPWKKLEYMFGKHRSTLAKYLRDDLYRMTLVLNTDKKIRQKLQFCI